VALSGKTFRIFISSTFSDLKEERNALQERVFPRLRDLCMAHGFRFQAIDLRWGVSEEASLDQQTVRICLEEIARCQKTALKPNFIVLLGDRYGWCPLPYEIPASEFEEIERRVNDSSTHELLATWYRRDDNAVPPVYCLQRRTGEFVDLSVWEERVERPLRAVLLEAVAGMDLSEDDRLKYATSATEQEVVRGAMKVEDAREHIFCFFRSFLVERADGSVAAQRENGHLSPVDEVSRDGDFHHFVDRAPHGEFDPGAYAQLANLKGRLESLLPGKTMKYQARWTDSGVTLSHLDALCTDVYDSLSREIMKQISRSGKTDPEELEDQAHEEFGEERARIFVGRAAILDTIRKYIRSENRHPLAIYGEPGSGKSALMARAVHEAREDNPGAEVIIRFVGATPASTDGRSLLEDLCRRVGRAYGSKEETPLEYRDLVQEFTKRLKLATKERPLILFLDALDQLSDADHARNLTWLPGALPENVGLIVSAIPGEGTDAPGRKMPPDRIVVLGPMVADEGSDLLDRWLSANRRTLRPDQKSEVLGKFEKCGLPLYLKLAFEEARRWKSYDDLSFGTDGKSGLSGDVPGLIDDLLRRLSREEEHGNVLVSRGLGYVASGKNGLTEDELLDVLSCDSEVIKDFQRRSPKSPPVSALPVIIWSRLRSDLDRYLGERQADGTSTISFFHRQFEKTIARNYLTGNSKRARHESLAHYFASRQLWLETAGKKTPNLRKVSELPFQHAHGGMTDGLRETLIDFDFLYAKVFALGPHSLIADFDLAFIDELHIKTDMPDESLRFLGLIQGALRLSAHLLARDPDLLPGQLTGRLLSYDLPEIHALLYQIGKRKEVPWLRPMSPSLEPPGGPLLRTLDGHKNGVWALAITRDGKRAISGSKDATLKVWDLETGEALCTLECHSDGVVVAIAVTPDGRSAVLCSGNKTLKVRDLETGEDRFTLDGHAGGVWAVAITRDGRRAVSGSTDTTLKVWDLETGETLRTLEGHTEAVSAVAVTPDGKKVVSASWDATLKVWDLETGEELGTLKGHTDKVWAITVTQDGTRAVSGSSDTTLKVWDLEALKELGTLEGHKDKVKAVAVTPDGRRAISLDDSNTTLRLWDLETFEMLRTLEGHTHWVLTIAVTPDGRRAVSGSEDNTLKVWNLEAGREERTPAGHTQRVSCVAVTPDGRRAVSGSEDQTLKVWDLESGKELRTLMGHTRSVNAVAVTPDGRRAVSASGDGTVKVWDIETGQALRTLEGHADAVSAIAVTSDGKRAVSASDESALKTWDLETGEVLYTLESQDRRVSTVAVTPDGKRAVYASMDKTLKVTLNVFDLTTGATVHVLEGGVGRVAVAPNGWGVVEASGKKIMVVDLETGEVLQILEGDTEWIEVVAVTPDAKGAISRCDGALKVWDLGTGKALCDLKGHIVLVNVVEVTPDGGHVVSGSYDMTLRMWELQSGEEIACFGGDSGFTATAVTWDGNTIIAGEESGRIHFLRIENIVPGSPIVTAFASPVHGDVAFGCPLCRNWSLVPPSALGRETGCPRCRKIVRLNRFTTNTDWRPIEKAWRGDRK